MMMTGYEQNEQLFRQFIKRMEGVKNNRKITFTLFTQMPRRRRASASEASSDEHKEIYAHRMNTLHYKTRLAILLGFTLSEGDLWLHGITR